MKRILPLLVLLAAGCSRQAALNYRHCLKLRIGMTREQIMLAMGEPDESFPYVEGVTLPHLKGKTAHEWSTPASMAAPNRVSIDDASGKAESIRCGDSVITAAVFIEPPDPVVSTTTIYGEVEASSAPVPAPARAPAPRRALKERGSSSSQSSGRPLTE